MSTSQRSGSELDALRGAPILVAPPAEVEAERARLVPWLEREIAELPLARAASRARSRRLVVSGLLAAAAGVGLAFWLVGAGQVGGQGDAPLLAGAPAATLLDGRLESGTLEVLPGSRLGEESRFRTPTAGGARLLTAAGATLAAFPETEFVLSPRKSGAADSELIELRRGAIGFSVPKLSPGHTFRVQTEDALVTVVGTRFFVDAGTPSCVRVEEGSVKVQRGGQERLLGAGDAWGCQSPGGDGSAQVEGSTEGTGSEGDGPAVASESGAREAGQNGSQSARGQGQLDQQNRLLAAALAAERRGDVGRARRGFQELIARYPDSPFGPEARAGLARLKGD